MVSFTRNQVVHLDGISIDYDGQEITPKNLDSDQIRHLNELKAAARSIESPTINQVLDVAEGTESRIDLYLLDKPGFGTVMSEITPFVDLQKAFNGADDLALGVTVSTVQSGDMTADVVLERDHFNTSMAGETTLAVLAFVDELFHAVSLQPSSKDKAASDHSEFYSALKKELAGGVLKLDSAQQVVVEEKIEKFAPVKQEGNGP